MIVMSRTLGTTANKQKTEKINIEKKWIDGNTDSNTNTNTYMY